jgi:hypothetical protein
VLVHICKAAFKATYWSHIQTFIALQVLPANLPVIPNFDLDLQCGWTEV